MALHADIGGLHPIEPRWRHGISRSQHSIRCWAHPCEVALLPFAAEDEGHISFRELDKRIRFERSGMIASG
jgi:hypothetical protein